LELRITARNWREFQSQTLRAINRSISNASLPKSTISELLVTARAARILFELSDINSSPLNSDSNYRNMSFGHILQIS
jgi:hypothetical protein